jgi:hypothetical protein
MTGVKFDALSLTILPLDSRPPSDGIFGNVTPIMVCRPRPG